jgi:hypothetical protein
MSSCADWENGLAHALPSGAATVPPRRSARAAAAVSATGRAPPRLRAERTHDEEEAQAREIKRSLGDDGGTSTLLTEERDAIHMMPKVTTGAVVVLRERADRGARMKIPASAAPQSGTGDLPR